MQDHFLEVLVLDPFFPWMDGVLLHRSLTGITASKSLCFESFLSQIGYLHFDHFVVRTGYN